jgi:hypothetical protein
VSETPQEATPQEPGDSTSQETAAVTPRAADATPETVSDDERREALAKTIANNIKGGWRVESQTEYTATMAKGHRPNHVLHLILTIITVGVWLIVWILVSILSGEKRLALRVDAAGEVWQTKS